MEIQPTKRQLAFFNSALSVADNSDYAKHHLGSVLVDGHRIISSGYNSKSRVSPTQTRLNFLRFNAPSPGYIHAETDCIVPLLRQNYDLSSSCLYVARKHQDGSLALARPCAGCMSLIRASGIKWIYYTTENGYAKEKL